MVTQWKIHVKTSKRMKNTLYIAIKAKKKIQEQSLPGAFHPNSPCTSTGGRTRGVNWHQRLVRVGCLLCHKMHEKKIYVWFYAYCGIFFPVATNAELIRQALTCDSSMLYLTHNSLTMYVGMVYVLKVHTGDVHIILNYTRSWIPRDDRV